jgi:hypothetical protein
MKEVLTISSIKAVTISVAQSSLEQRQVQLNAGFGTSS